MATSSQVPQPTVSSQIDNLSIIPFMDPQRLKTSQNERGQLGTNTSEDLLEPQCLQLFNQYIFIHVLC